MIADCVVKENKIVEEWLVRDDLSIIRQIGLEETEFVKKLYNLTPEKFSVAAAPRHPGPEKSSETSPPKSAIEDFVKHTWRQAWNNRNFEAFIDSYCQ